MDFYMQQALEQAKKSLDEGGIPTGAVLVKNDAIIGLGHNIRLQKHNPLGHAIIDCIINAGRIGSFRDTILYTTTMPCFMCAGVIVQFGISRLIVGENINFNTTESFLTSHGIEVVNLNLEECKWILVTYIKQNPDIWYEDIGQL